MNANYHPDDCHSPFRKATRILIAFLLCLAANSRSANAQNPLPDNAQNPTGNAPNLVANPSFEDVNICAEYNQPCSPSAWFFGNRKVTSGYFPRFPSATGLRHLQIVAASRETPNRQYWETKLLCPLQAGERYRVSLKISGIGGRPNLRDLGFWFTDGFVFSKADSLLQPRSYLHFTDATIKDSKNGWLEISKEFTPARNATFLIIGNFYSAANNDIMDQRQRPEPTIEFGIDDLVITPLKGTICPDYEKAKDSLYAILRRHSNPPYGDPDNDVDEPSAAPRPVTLPPGRDTTNRATPTNRPTDSGAHTDPPARPTDTALRNPTPAPFKTDTLIIRNIQFEFDRYLVDNPDTLLRYRKILTRPGIKKIQVVGYTDDKGTDAYNKDLSEKRAHEVARLLTAKFGIDASLIQAEGRGISKEYKDSNLNRRVEIYIFH